MRHFQLLWHFWHFREVQSRVDHDCTLATIVRLATMVNCSSLHAAFACCSQLMLTFDL